MRWKLSYAFFGVSLLMFDVCNAVSNDRAAPRSLYERMGGEGSMAAVINDMVDTVTTSARTRRAFADVNLKNLKKHLAEKFCELAGGGCQYTGDSIHDVHAGLQISQAEFYSLVQILRDVMVRHGIGLRERNEMLQLLAPMKRDIVEK